MKREDLEHIVRAAGSLTSENPLIVVGSQAILATYPHPPGYLAKSMELDISPLSEDQTVLDMISGNIGEVSTFHETFRYYAHGHPPSSCALPLGWKERLIKVENVNTNGFTALCLHPIDLAVSKLVAGRDKDLRFVATLLAHAMVLKSDIFETIGRLPRNEWRDAATTHMRIAEHRADVISQYGDPDDSSPEPESPSPARGADLPRL